MMLSGDEYYGDDVTSGLEASELRAAEAFYGVTPTSTASARPDEDTLMEWMDEGGCEATDGCWVEVDGTCPHGKRSWALVMGLV